MDDSGCSAKRCPSSSSPAGDWQPAELVDIGSDVFSEVLLSTRRSIGAIPSVWSSRHTESPSRTTYSPIGALLELVNDVFLEQPESTSRSSMRHALLTHASPIQIAAGILGVFGIC